MKKLRGREILFLFILFYIVLFNFIHLALQKNVQNELNLYSKVLGEMLQRNK